MHGYKAFYRGKSIEVHAETTYGAQQLAAKQFKAKKRYEVDVYLCEKDTDGTKPGTQVVHTAVN